MKKKNPVILTDKKTFLIVSGLLLAFFYVAGVLYIGYTNGAKRALSKDFFTFTKVPDDTVVTASLKTKNGTYDLAVVNNALQFSDEAKIGFSVPFVLSVQLRDVDSIRNILITLDDRGVGYAATLDGFAPSDAVSFGINASESVHEVPFDWSGRSKLEALLYKDGDMKICVKIKAAKPLDFCQLIVGKANPA